MKVGAPDAQVFHKKEYWGQSLLDFGLEDRRKIEVEPEEMAMPPEPLLRRIIERALGH